MVSRLLNHGPSARNRHTILNGGYACSPEVFEECVYSRLLCQHPVYSCFVRHRVARYMTSYGPVVCSWLMPGCVHCCRYSGARNHSGVHAGAPGCRGCPQQAGSPAVCRLQFGARPSEYQLDSRRQDSAASQRHPPLPPRQRLALH